MTDFIQWPCAQYWDNPWNPFIGCRPASPACDNCYARTATERFNCSFDPHIAKKQNPPRKGVVFCGNMTDLFGEWVDIYDAVGTIEKTLGNSDNATYLWLTKRPQRMLLALDEGVMNHHDEDGDQQSPFYDCEFRNQFFGFTAENQEWYDRRFKIWRTDKPTWANGWLSAEPLLGPIDLHINYIAPEDLPFKWIVVGCESGANRRPCNIEWVESIVSQAMARDIPVFVKQLAIGGMCVKDINLFPRHLQIRQVPWEMPKCEGGMIKEIKK